MGKDPSSERNASDPKFLSKNWLIALIVAFCIVVPVAGAFAEAVGGWLGAAIWLVAWGVMAIVAVAVTSKYANPFLPTLCGIMVGATAPRPSDAWALQLLGGGWGRALNFLISIVAIGIGLTIFSAIAKKHKAPSSG